VKFDVRQFSTFRLVCKKWNNVSLPIWRKNAKLKIFEEDVDEDNDGVLTDAGYMTLLQSPEDRYQLKKQPFRKYIITDWDLNFDQDEEKLGFWTKVGPLMRHLCLDSCTFERVEDFRKILFELTPNLESLELNQNKFKCDRPIQKASRLDPTRKEHLKPENVQKNLKKFKARLELEEVDYDDDAIDWDVLPITWIELFAHFPNIERMLLMDLENEEGSASDELVECVKSMEITRDNLGSEYFAKLKELDIFRA